MKKILSILLIFAFFGCATDSSMLVRLNKLESQVQQVDKSEPKEYGPVINKDKLQELAESGEAVKIRGFNCTTGGASGCLDNYPAANLVAGDLGMVFNASNGVVTFHVFDDDDSTTPIDPEFIAPADRTGNELWKLFTGFRYMPQTIPTLRFRDADNDNVQTVIAAIEANSAITADPVTGSMVLYAMGAGTLRDYIHLSGYSGLQLYYRSNEDWILNGTYTGIILSDYEAGENINQWSMVYFDESEGQWMNADADETSGGKNWPARGMAVYCSAGWPCENGETMLVLIHGKVRNDSWEFDQWGEDGALYLSNTAGGLLDKDAVATSLNTSGDCIQIVGWAINNDTMVVAPSLNWLEVE